MCYRVIACILLAAFVANALTESEMEVPESTEMSSEIFAQETANAGLWRRRRGSGKRSKGGKSFLHKFIKSAAHKFHTGFVKKNEVEKNFILQEHRRGDAPLPHEDNNFTEAGQQNEGKA
jgi:hypothetical protein